MTYRKSFPLPIILLLFTIGLAESAYLITGLARPLLAKPEPVVTWEPVTDPRFIVPERFRGWVRQYAAEFNIPQDVATRLGFEESGWVEGLISRNRNGTYDHNVFQTNSRYFKVTLTQQHIHDAMKHFAWCWKVAGTLKGAVIVWNAGYSRLGNPPRRSVQLAETVTRGQL